jgi:hypothetical protein
MAEDEHLSILKQGVGAWNQWRDEHPEIRPTLDRAKLEGFYLVRVNLSHADLSGVKFGGANLTQADLEHANLQYADLSHARLLNAYLNEADLREASLICSEFTSTALRNAILKETNLGHADFRESDLRAADFSKAFVSNTTFQNTDLSVAIGLETVEHGGPSSIDIDTLYRSKGIIPEAFLRGCGLPADAIEFVRSIALHPIEFNSCFICYSSKDQELAERLYSDLQGKGVRCWFAPHDLKIGDKLRQSLDEAIRLHDKLMVLLSEHSVKSTWVEKEVETAFEKERQQSRIVLFPIRLDDVVMGTNEAWAGDIRRTRHIGDFRDWKDHDSYKKAFDRLLRDLRAEDKAEVGNT